MQTIDEKNSNNDASKTLVVGDIGKVLLNGNRINDGRITQCDNMLSALSTASSVPFAKIFVIISELGKHLEEGLVALRRIRPDSKITLLAQMYEEPQAIRLARSPRNPDASADGYLICPVTNNVFTNGKPITQETTRPVTEKSIAPTAVVEASPDQLDEKLIERIRHLERLATQDDLTNLKNRRYVREFLSQILQRAKNENLSVTLLVFDIDNFKHYNDSFGHTVGDNVLQQAAIMMRGSCREHDVIARIGGDEFAVVFWDKPAEEKNGGSLQLERRKKENAEHPAEVFFISERFRKEISSSNLSSLGVDGKGELTISGGLASFPRDGQTVKELFEQADKAMLSAKRSGKNRIYLVGSPK